MKPENLSEQSIPWDGVKPNHYPERYDILMRCRCIKGAGVAVQPIHPRKRLCIMCYLIREEPNGYQFRDIWHSITTELFALRPEDKMCCCECGKTIMTMRPAHECQKCIETFITYERAFDRFVWLRRNWEKEIRNDE